MVKANAYGLGLKEVALALNDRVRGFCVATLLEAKALAKICLGKQILVLNGGLENQPCEEYSHDSNFIIPTISCLKDLQRCRAKKINIKINTGMNRTGIFPHQTDEVFEQANEKFEVFSVFSHLCDPSDAGFTCYQIHSFVDAVSNLPSSTYRHLYASNFLSVFQDNHFSLIRAGLSLYGYGDNHLKPALKVTTSILQIISAYKGDHVGYGNVILKNDSTLAAIRIGYADGFRRLSNVRYVCVNGYICQVLAVCMDISIIDITAAIVNTDSEVEIISENIPLNVLAASYQTNEYEVLTSFMGERLTRIYI